MSDPLNIQMKLKINPTWKPITLQAIKLGITAGTVVVRNRAFVDAPHDTGNLRNSIQRDVKVSGEGVTGRVWTNVEYAIYQEYGTGRFSQAGNINQKAKTHTPAHPYMRPAIYDNSYEIVQVVNAVIAQALK